MSLNRSLNSVRFQLKIIFPNEILFFSIIKKNYHFVIKLIYKKKEEENSRG